MKPILTSLLIITYQLVAAAETLALGDHAEFPLRAPAPKIDNDGPPPEVENVQIPTITGIDPPRPRTAMRP